MARYADACNFFGDVATIEHKLAVLDDRCADVGRDSCRHHQDPAGAVVIGDTHEQAVAKAEEIAAGAGSTAARAVVHRGGRRRRGRAGRAFLDAGLDGMIISCPDAHELEPVELVGRTLAGRLGSATVV